MCVWLVGGYTCIYLNRMIEACGDGVFTTVLLALLSAYIAVRFHIKLSSIFPTVWYRRLGLVYGIFGRLRCQRLAESTVLFVLHPCSHLSSATVSVSGKWSAIKVKTATFNRCLLGSVYWCARRCFHTDWQHCSTMRFLREIRLHLQTISALWKCAVWTHSRPGWESTWKCEPWFMSCSIFQCHHRPTAINDKRFLRQPDLGQMIWPCHRDVCAGWSCPQFYVEMYDWQ